MPIVAILSVVMPIVVAPQLFNNVKGAVTFDPADT